MEQPVSQALHAPRRRRIMINASHRTFRPSERQVKEHDVAKANTEIEIHRSI